MPNYLNGILNYVKSEAKFEYLQIKAIICTMTMSSQTVISIDSVIQFNTI